MTGPRFPRMPPSRREQFSWFGQRTVRLFWARNSSAVCKESHFPQSVSIPRPSKEIIRRKALLPFGSGGWGWLRGNTLPPATSKEIHFPLSVLRDKLAKRVSSFRCRAGREQPRCLKGVYQKPGPEAWRVKWVLRHMCGWSAFGANERGPSWGYPRVRWVCSWGDCVSLFAKS